MSAPAGAPGGAPAGASSDKGAQANSPAQTKAPDPPREKGCCKGREPRFKQISFGAEAMSYDYLSLRPPGRKTTVIESIGHLIKSCLGGGITVIHMAYIRVGLLSALVLNVFLGFLVAFCMVVLAKSAQKTFGRVHVSKLSYPELAEATMSICPWPKYRKYSVYFRYLVDITIMIDLFGSCCAYQVAMAKSLNQILSDVGLMPVIDDRIYIAMLLIPCILISMILTLKYLAPFSIVADIIIVIVVITTILFALSMNSQSVADFPKFKGVVGMYEFIGTCVFSMEGVGATLAIENNMKEPKKIGLVLYTGMVIVVTLVMTVGFFGYWGFGEDALEPVTNNFGQWWFPTALKCGLCLMIYVTFGLNFWVPFDLAWCHIKEKYPVEKHWYVQRLYRAGFVCVITVVAIVLPGVNDLVSVIGAFCLSNMGFIYPAFIQLSLDYHEPGLGRFKWRLWRCIGLVVFGVMLLFLGTYFSVVNLLNNVYFNVKPAKNDTTTATKLMLRNTSWYTQYALAYE